jgi:HrpA-like RNA helicase
MAQAEGSKRRHSMGPPTKKRRVQPPASSREQLLEDRKRLPLWSAREKLVERVRAHRTLIVVGETGSGKTTQIPQFLYEAGFAERGRIACTQPRRVAACTVARRVSDEMGTKLGELVGYSVRFDDTTSPQTRIKYLTDGMLLREALLDPKLSRWEATVGLERLRGPRGA